jgi:L-threonylcarbamoyladenylate synthase
MGVESTVIDLTQSPPAILRPGGVSREQLEKVLGAVRLATGVADEVAHAGLAGPGMTLKHYAPRAQVELFENAEELQTRAAKLRHEGKRVGVLDTATTIERLAQTVFAQLRDLDTQGVEMILCLLPAPQGLGLAVRDRLLRAAGKGGQT